MLKQVGLNNTSIQGYDEHLANLRGEEVAYIASLVQFQKWKKMMDFFLPLLEAFM